MGTHWPKASASYGDSLQVIADELKEITGGRFVFGEQLLAGSQVGTEVFQVFAQGFDLLVGEFRRFEELLKRLDEDTAAPPCEAAKVVEGARRGGVDRKIGEMALEVIAEVGRGRVALLGQLGGSKPTHVLHHPQHVDQGANGRLDPPVPLEEINGIFIAEFRFLCWERSF